jgi:hypothetical protein
MWFPGICKKAIIKKTGREVLIREFFNDHVVFVEKNSFWQRGSYPLKDLELIWPDCIPVDQRCNSTLFSNLVGS